MGIYSEVARMTGVMEQSHTIKNSFIDRISSLPRYLYNAMRYNPMRGNETVDTIIFDHARHMYVEGENIDIYTKNLIEDFEQQNHNYLVLEQPYDRRHYKKPSPRRKYLDALIVWGFLRRQLMRIKISPDKTEEIIKIESSINEHFNIKINLLETFVRHTKRFKVNHELYTNIFKKRKPMRIFLVVSYGQGDMIKAAKDLGIETIELQHGVFGRYHMGYSFPGRKTPLDYLPDKFYVWSEYWRGIIELPLALNNVVIYGFAHLQRSKSKYAGISRDRLQILILSQGPVGSRMADYIRTNFHYLKNFKLVYKLHPGEYDRWNTYPALKELVEHENVRLVKDADLYRLMSESYYQMGVGSTAIFEGIDFGCRTILLDLPGIEYMFDLLESGTAMTFEEFLERENSPA